MMRLDKQQLNMRAIIHTQRKTLDTKQDNKLDKCVAHNQKSKTMATSAKETWTNSEAEQETVQIKQDHN